MVTPCQGQHTTADLISGTCLRLTGYTKTDIVHRMCRCRLTVDEAPNPMVAYWLNKRLAFLASPASGRLREASNAWTAILSLIHVGIV